MQHLSRAEKRNLARWTATIILAVLAAIFGRDHVPVGRQSPQNPSEPLPDGFSGAARPIDGDSLHVGRYEVRLKGIDAPEGRQSCTRNGAAWPCGEESRRQLVQIIGKDVVVCRVADRDRFNRYLSYCTAGGRDLNAGMVAAGFAVAFGGYVREEGEAKARKRGLWAGEFQRPREWRDAHQIQHN